MPTELWAALIGATAGLLAGLGGAFVTVRAQGQQADRERWAHRRQEAYAEVLLALQEFEKLLADWYTTASVAHQTDRKWPETMDRDATEAFDRAFERAALIASWRGHALPRLTILNHAVFIARMSTYRGDGDRDAILAAVDAARQGLNKDGRDFARAARKELGVEDEGVMRGWRARRRKVRDATAGAWRRRPWG